MKFQIITGKCRAGTSLTALLSSSSQLHLNTGFFRTSSFLFNLLDCGCYFRLLARGSVDFVLFTAFFLIGRRSLAQDLAGWFNVRVSGLPGSYNMFGQGVPP